MTWAWLRAVFGVRSVVLDSPLSTATCRQRLEDALMSQTGSAAGNPIVGYVRENEARLKTKSADNGTTTHMRVRLRRCDTGANLLCSLSTGPIVTAILWIWIGYWALLSPLVTLATPPDPDAPLRRGMVDALVGSALPVLFALGVLAIRRFNSRPEDVLLLGFVAQAADVTRTFGTPPDDSLEEEDEHQEGYGP